jgi:RNA polymerase sigma factor (sigma-70 family)
MKTNLEYIVNRCKAGDHQAFETLYKTYYRVLFGMALRYTRNQAEAEDILQDAFIKIFQSISSYKSSGSFEGWMRRVVQNTAINHYRSSLRFNLYVEVSEKEDNLNDDSMDILLDALEAKDIIALLNRMPEGYRMVINLFYIDGYSHKEISEMLNISKGTSKSQLFKAKHYLKEMLENDYKQNIV